MKYLDNQHKLQERVKDLKGESDLRYHLVFQHLVQHKSIRKHGDLAKLHLLAHAVEAFPELQQVFFDKPIGVITKQNKLRQF